MRILMLNGSAHEAGCTATAMREVERMLQEAGIGTEWFFVGDDPAVLAPARVKECAALMDGCDGMVIGSPVYYAGCAGLLKAFLDRLFSTADAKTWALKPGCCVISYRRAGAVAAFDDINRYFTINQMPVVASKYWNEIHGSDPSQTVRDLEGLQNLRVLGRNLAWLVRSIAAAGIPKPEAERPVKTNFIS